MNKRRPAVSKPSETGSVVRELRRIVAELHQMNEELAEFMEKDPIAIVFPEDEEDYDWYNEEGELVDDYSDSNRNNIFDMGNTRSVRHSDASGNYSEEVKEDYNEE